MEWALNIIKKCLVTFLFLPFFKVIFHRGGVFAERQTINVKRHTYTHTSHTEEMTFPENSTK